MLTLCSYKNFSTNIMTNPRQSIKKAILLGIYWLVSFERRLKYLLEQWSYYEINNSCNLQDYKNNHYLFYPIDKKRLKVSLIIEFYDIASIII